MHSIYAMNGKSVEIDNTDAEGRLILSGRVILFHCLILAYLNWDRCFILHLDDLQAPHALRCGHTHRV